MGRSGIKVTIRMRPMANMPLSHIQIDPDENAITVLRNQTGQQSNLPSSPLKPASSPSKYGSAPSNRKDQWNFKFHQVLHDCDQEHVYESMAKDIVQGTVGEGVNGTILAYGQTGTGKSFTMIGDTRNYQHRGIAPRSIAQIFQEVDNRIEMSYDIWVSYMEIYNDRIYDLLDPAAGIELPDNRTGEPVVIEDGKGTYVRGLTHVAVRTEQEALDQLFYGELQRTVSEHRLNKRSNRSHCIFTIHLARKSRIGGNEKVLHSKLHLVDLAGSERLKKTVDDETSVSALQKESMYINQSLSFLEQCIVALGSKEHRHVPYRQSKLTNVLKDSLGGNSNTLMFACIWGDSTHLEETISTLKLAQRMMRVQNETSTIYETDPGILLRKYEKQIKELKQELVMHDALTERSGVIYDEHTPEQKHQLLKRIQDFLEATSQTEEDEMLHFSSVNEIRELFRQFKRLYKNVENDVSTLRASTATLRGHSAGSNASRSQASTAVLGDGHHGNSARSQGEELVGEEDPKSIGFPLGQVANSARPTTIDSMKKKKSDRVEEHAPEVVVKHIPDTDAHPTKPERGGSLRLKKQNHKVGDQQPETQAGNNTTETIEVQVQPPNAYESAMKSKVFKHYQMNIGKEVRNDLGEEKAKLSEAKQKAKQLTSKLNEAKAKIDEAQAKIMDKQRQKEENAKANGTITAKQRAKLGLEEDEEVVDEEEFLAMTAERQAKRDYRNLYGELKEATSEIEFAKRSVELLKMRLARDFDEWYAQQDPTMLEALSEGANYEQLELERVRAQDPDSVAFFQAQKKMRKLAEINALTVKTSRKQICRF